MTEAEARDIIIRERRKLGRKLVILGHHYQTDAVIEFADYTGDSLELSRRSASLNDAEIIIFCGVYFMAETAVILSPGKEVYIPDKTAGCPLADMADIEAVERAWQAIEGSTAVPVTYVNSSALIKAFCGRNGGMVCTSGNAQNIFRRALEEEGRIFFIPDMNLGRNTARSLGISDDETVVWDPAADSVDGAVKSAKIVLWKGYCPIHYPVFDSEDIKRFRSENPGGKVILHPESDPDAVMASDRAASTAGIIEYVRGLDGAAVVAVGTEANMVKRLAGNSGTVKVVPIKEAYCNDMAKITLEKLAGCISSLSGEYRVNVPEDTAGDARKALMRMLEV